MPVVFEELRPDLSLARFSSAPSDDDVRDFIGHNIAGLARKIRHCLVVDMLAVTRSNPNQRKMTSAYVGQYYSELQQLRAGTAFVVRSPFTRGIVTAIMWMQRPPYPFVLTATVEEALSWCTRQLDGVSKVGA